MMYVEIVELILILRPSLGFRISNLSK